MANELDDQLLIEKKDKSEIITTSVTYIDYLQFLQQVINSDLYLSSLIDTNYQVVLTNSHLIKEPGLAEIGRLIVGQPGNIINCYYERKSELKKNEQLCFQCNIIDTIKKSRIDVGQVKNEFRINNASENNVSYYDLRIICSPIFIEREMYTLMKIENISEVKRKEDLQKVFFHDILNRLGGFKGIIELVKSGKSHCAFGDYVDMLDTIGDMIVEDILTQRYLESPENNNLIVDIREYSSTDIIESVRKQIAFHPVMNTMNINLSVLCSDFKFNTNSALLKRILLNMIKNAAEASPSEGIIRISAFRKNASVIFSVNNSVSIPAVVQKRIFQRSFSTKSNQRGLGTYSMKLFGEIYLKGKVYFHSTEKSGTTFYIELPVK